MRCLGGLCLAVLSCAACLERGPRPPQPLAIAPASVSFGEPAPLVISGRNFWTQASANFGGGSTRVSAEFQVLLGEQALQDVVWVDSRTLRATVPAGLAVGVYDLRVIAPSGRAGGLPAAFSVVSAPGPSCSNNDTTCDTVDDDCDGSTDEDFVVLATQCGLGVCASVGQRTCVGGVVVDDCAWGAATGQDDDCNGIDEDCDGTADDAYTPDAACGVGACRDGNIASACVDGVETPCSPGAAQPEGPAGAGSCSDGADNDCDGLTDVLDLDCVESAPLAVARVTPPAGDTTTLFTADASASSDRETPAALLYEWDWDSDGVFDAAGVMATGTFALPGWYAVRLRATDPGGLSAEDVFFVLVAAVGDVVRVTTEVDELDPGDTPAAFTGAGLSLREAVLYAEATAGAQVVTLDLLPPGTVINLQDTLAIGADPDGTSLVGDGVAFDGSAVGGAGADCMTISGDNAIYAGWELRGCNGWPVNVTAGATNNRFTRLRFVDNSWEMNVAGGGNFVGPACSFSGSNNNGLYLAAPGVVTANRVFGNTKAGVVLTSGAAGSTVELSASYDNGTSGIAVLNMADNLVVQHNTLVGNATHGVAIANNIDGTLLRNNILVANGEMGIDAKHAASGTVFLELRNNLLFGNTLGACSNCTLGLGDGAVLADPLFMDAAARDLRLGLGSPAIDAGVDVGLDLNGALPGLFAGAAPDIGAFEAP